MHTRRKSAFTLIELLMVIAIISILAGILIPSVGAVKKQANIAASKAQLSAYVNAIQMFKGEYKFLPFVNGAADATVDIARDSENFIRTLSGRIPNTGAIDNTDTGNRRRIAFHSFSESEFLFDGRTDTVSTTQLADRFGNILIHLRIDGNGDGFVTPDVAGSGDPEAPGQVRGEVTAWVEENSDEGFPGYGLWN